MHPVNGTPVKRHGEDCSLNSLFNSTNKDPDSPLANNRFDDDERIGNSEKVMNLNDEFPMRIKDKKFASENVIMINPSQQEPILNEEEHYNELLDKRKITEESIE